MTDCPISCDHSNSELKVHYSSHVLKSELLVLYSSHCLNSEQAKVCNSNVHYSDFHCSVQMESKKQTKNAQNDMQSISKPNFKLSLEFYH